MGTTIDPTKILTRDEAIGVLRAGVDGTFVKMRTRKAAEEVAIKLNRVSGPEVVYEVRYSPGVSQMDWVEVHRHEAEL